MLVQLDEAIGAIVGLDAPRNAAKVHDEGKKAIIWNEVYTVDQ